MKKAFCKIISSVLISLLLILALPTIVPIWARAADTVKIGDLNPYSGPFEFIGRTYRLTIDFAVEEQNAKGGLLGRKIEIISEDTEFKPDTAVRKAKELILNRKVNFISSASGSHIAIALSKVATQYKTIGMNYGYGHPVPKDEFTRYYFRTNLNPYNCASALAQLMAKKPYRNFYIICQDYAYGHASAEAFKEQLRTYLPNAKIVGEDFHPVAIKDFGPYINKIIAAKADCIYSSNFGVDGQTLVKQARDLGLKVPFPIAMISVNPIDLNVLKDDAVGIHHVYSYMLRVNTPENQQMIAKWHQKHKNDKDFENWWPWTHQGAAVLSWKFLFAAVEKAGSLDPEKIIDAFEGFRWKSPVGWWEMRKSDHQVLMPMFGGIIQGGNNPYYNGSIRPDVKFPWDGPDILHLSANATASPPFGF